MNCRVFILMRNIAYHRNFHRNSCATCAHAQTVLITQDPTFVKKKPWSTQIKIRSTSVTLWSLLGRFFE